MTGATSRVSPGIRVYYLLFDLKREGARYFTARNSPRRFSCPRKSLARDEVLETGTAPFLNNGHREGAKGTGPIDFRYVPRTRVPPPQDARSAINLPRV